MPGKLHPLNDLAYVRTLLPAWTADHVLILSNPSRYEVRIEAKAQGKTYTLDVWFMRPNAEKAIRDWVQA